MNSIDNAREWFLKRVLLPKIFVINNPGFITGRYFELMGLGHFSRHIFLPEALIVDLENRIIKKMGGAGRKMLYGAAKVSTWRFCRVMGIPPFAPNKVSSDSKLLFTFLETMYAKSLKVTVDENNKLMTMIGDDVAVCGENGEGYFVPVGALAGLWSYGYQDKSLEAVQTKCQGRKDKNCKFLAGPKTSLKNNAVAFGDFSEFKKGNNYEFFNKVTNLGKPSLEDMVNKYFFKYRGGVLEIWGERFFPFEIGYLYMLESEIRKNNCEDILFDASYSFHKRLIDKGTDKDALSFMVSFLKAIGWGKLTALKGKKSKVIVEHFPWTSIYGKSESFPIFAGAVSAFLSKEQGRELRLSISEKSLVDHLVVTFEEL